jgi:hypothetical protein
METTQLSAADDASSIHFHRVSLEPVAFRGDFCTVAACKPSRLSRLVYFVRKYKGDGK